MMTMGDTKRELELRLAAQALEIDALRSALVESRNEALGCHKDYLLYRERYDQECEYAQAMRAERDELLVGLRYALDVLACQFIPSPGWFERLCALVGYDHA